MFGWIFSCMMLSLKAALGGMFWGLSLVLLCAAIGAIIYLVIGR